MLEEAFLTLDTVSSCEIYTRARNFLHVPRCLHLYEPLEHRSYGGDAVCLFVGGVRRHAKGQT